ncbi:hypothetical protein COOONC_08087, partial [Cooperia oncophora]
KFADKITTYFQCAISTCLIAEGTCNGKTPPSCGPVSQRPRVTRSIADPRQRNSTRSRWIRLDNTMDVSAQKITVLDLNETPSGTGIPKKSLNSHRNLLPILCRTVVLQNDAVCISPQIAIVFTLVAIASTIAVVMLGLLLTLRYRAMKTFD